jgi:hypothetical protein
MNPLSISGFTSFSGPFCPDVLHPAERERPDHPQVLDVVAIDLRQLGVACRPVVAVHQQPVLRLVAGVDQTGLIDGQRVVGRKRRTERDDGDGADQSAGRASE